MRLTKIWALFLFKAFLLFILIGAVYAGETSVSTNQIPGIPDVVARVNGHEVSSKNIKFQYMRILKDTRAPMTSSQRDIIVRKVIDKEVIRELMYQEGQKLNFNVDPKTVEAELSSLQAAYKDEGDFKKALVERNITEEDLKKAIKVDALAKLILEKQVKGQVKIDDKEVQKYYKDNKENFLRPVAFRARHVFISFNSPDNILDNKEHKSGVGNESFRKKAREAILEIQIKLNSGADFSELVKKYSHDESTAENEGDLGFFYADGVEKSFADAVSGLKVGEFSDIVETSFGFHLIKLTDTKPSEYAPFEDMKEAIQKHLFMEKAQGRVSGYIANLRKKATIEIFY